MNVDGVDSDSEIDEAMTDTPPKIADEASAAKQDLLRYYITKVSPTVQR
jgi:hypothetical protein